MKLRQKEIAEVYVVIRTLYWFGDRGTCVSDSEFIKRHGSVAFDRYVRRIRELSTDEIDPYAIHFAAAIADVKIGIFLEEALNLPKEWGMQKAKVCCSIRGALSEFEVLLREWRLDSSYTEDMLLLFAPSRRRPDWPLY